MKRHIVWRPESCQEIGVTKCVSAGHKRKLMEHCASLEKAVVD
jgi:hypothetical protein